MSAVMHKSVPPVLQGCNAVCCSVLQCVAVCCNVLHCIAGCAGYECYDEPVGP